MSAGKLEYEVLPSYPGLAQVYWVSRSALPPVTGSRLQVQIAGEVKAAKIISEKEPGLGPSASLTVEGSMEGLATFPACFNIRHQALIYHGSLQRLESC